MEEDFHVLYAQTGDDIEKAVRELEKWDGHADALAIENIRLPLKMGPEWLLEQQENKINELCGFFTSPLSIGDALLEVCRKWSIRELVHIHGESLFEDADILFTSGMTDASLAASLAVYSDNMDFCDPVFAGGIPKILGSVEDLKLYAEYVYPFTLKVPVKKMADMAFPVRLYNEHLVFAAIKRADIIVVPHCAFFEHLELCGMEELEGKTVITSTVLTGRLNFLKQRGVKMIVDIIPGMPETITGPGVLEAMVMAAGGKNRHTVNSGHIENAIRGMQAEPRIIFPFGEKSFSR